MGQNKTEKDAFKWEDPFLLEERLSNEENMIRESVKKFSQEKLMPRIQEATKDEKFDVNIMREMGDMGLLGPTIKGYGCTGTNNVSYGLMAREIERQQNTFFCFFWTRINFVLQS